MNTVSKQEKSNNQHTVTENEFDEEDSNDYESKSEQQDDESSQMVAEDEQKESQSGINEKEDLPKDPVVENVIPKGDVKPVLSLERQLELAKYFYINEMRKTEWRNIILQVVRQAQSNSGITGYVVQATNAATNAMVELFLDEMAIKTKDEVKITKKLRTKGISLVEEDLKLFFLVPEKLQTV